MGTVQMTRRIGITYLSEPLIFLVMIIFLVIKLKLTCSLEQEYLTLSHVAITTSVAEKVVNSGKALATFSLTLWTISLFVVILYHTLLSDRSVQNGAISALLMGKLSGIESSNGELKERMPLLFS